MMTDRFNYPSYLVSRKFLRVLGAAFHIYDPTGGMVLYSEMKAFKLKEDIRLYTGEDMQEEVLHIQARQIIDFAAIYDVYVSETGEKIGALQRKGLKSIFLDEWLILDQQDRAVGLIKEDSLIIALIRRFVINLIPQKYSGEIGGKPVCTFQQNFNPFTMKITLDFSPDQGAIFDHRLGIAAAILLCAIEGKQN